MDLADKIHESDERKGRFRNAVSERIAEMEVEIPKALDDLKSVRKQLAVMEAIGPDHNRSGETTQDWRKKVEAATARVESLFRELAALEGGIERRTAATWRYVTFGVSLLALALAWLRLK